MALLSFFFMPFSSSVESGSASVSHKKLGTSVGKTVVLEPVETPKARLQPPPAVPPSRARDVLYEANTTVLESDEHGPMLCLGGIMESYPPQCGDVPIDGWDWDEVSGEESASGTTWGSYHVVGTYEEGRFGLVEAGRFRNERSGNGYDFSPACSDRLVTDPSKTSSEHFENAVTYANGQRDVSAVWVSYLDKRDAPEERDEELLNVGFTGNLAAHEAELRQRWGGPLCVVRYEYSRRELAAIRREAENMRGIRNQMLWSDMNEVDSYIQIGLIVLTDDLEAKVRRRYGDLVRLSGALQPVR